MYEKIEKIVILVFSVMPRQPKSAPKQQKSKIHLSFYSTLWHIQLTRPQLTIWASSSKAETTRTKTSSSSDSCALIDCCYKATGPLPLWIFVFTHKSVNGSEGCLGFTGGPPLIRKPLTWFPLPQVLAYVCASGDFSVSRGPQYSHTNTNFM